MLRRPLRKTPMLPSDIYTAEEFAEAFWRRGYGKKKHALKWLVENNIVLATEADFMHCYHETQNMAIQQHTAKYIAMYSDGQNPVSAGNTQNSNGKSFAAQMAEEMYEMDRLDSWIKRRHEEKTQCN